MPPDQPFNGECGREFRELGKYLEESVYCVSCGTIYVSNTECHRRCPACTLAEMIEETNERVHQLEEKARRLDRDIGVVDRRGIR